jgi:hypothetical protein
MFVLNWFQTLLLAIFVCFVAVVYWQHSWVLHASAALMGAARIQR